MNRFYFAYGSNMNPERIRERIPMARTVGPAVILGWRLKERLYADIERSAGGRVDGVLYLLTQIEIFRLDEYEGYPRTYGCVGVDAMIDPEHKVSAFTYVLTDAAKRADANPSPIPVRIRGPCGWPWPGWRRQSCPPAAGHGPPRGSPLRI